MSSTSLEHCIRYSNPQSKELSMTFNFHHLKVDYPNLQKWVAADFDFLQLKQILSDWQLGMQAGGGWNALFWCNHDQPRVVSRFGDDGEHRVVSAKMLATALHFLQGTPFVYQGEELGMTNPGFDTIDQYRDVETLNIYRLKREAGESEASSMAAIMQKSRDNGRTPMQWNADKNAGFSSGEPWIGIPANAAQINVQSQQDDPQSVLHHYRALIELRRHEPLIQEGVYRQLLPQHTQVWAYLREGQGERLLVLNNFYGTPCEIELPDGLLTEAHEQRLLISNYDDCPPRSSQVSLRPYESFVLYLKD
jgi:trehalose-6-phosphate hydrolase